MTEHFHIFSSLLFNSAKDRLEVSFLSDCRLCRHAIICSFYPVFLIGLCLSHCVPLSCCNLLSWGYIFAKIQSLLFFIFFKKKEEEEKEEVTYLSGSLQVSKVNIGDEEHGLGIQVGHGLEIGGVGLLGGTYHPDASVFPWR